MRKLFEYCRRLLEKNPGSAPASSTTGGKQDVEQKISALTEADKQHLRDQRSLIEQYLDDISLAQNYQTAAGKLGAIRAILEAGIFKHHQIYELQCLGVVLGDVFVQQSGMEWIVVEDIYGRDLAVRLPGTSLICYPLTMISKRIQRGETVDIFNLYNGVANEVESLKGQGA